MPDAAVLALDVGTSSCRASLFDLQAQPVPGRAVQITYRPRLTNDGGAELDPEALFDNVCASIDRVLQGQPPTRIVAVGVSTFWHSLLAVDASGKPLSPVYLWLDGRARGQVAPLKSQLDEHEIHARTGCVLHSTYWPARLRWLRETASEMCKEAARWISFAELLYQRLTGCIDVSLSMASGTGLLNIHTLDWDAPLLDFLELSPGQLGNVARERELPTSTRWPALRGVPWLPAVGDGACSNLGAGCASPDRFALMIGTSGAERAICSPSADFHVPWGLWCYRVDDRRVVTGGALNDGGSLLDWLRSTLDLPDVRSAEASVAAMEPDSHGLTVLPFWGGERNPGWADDARGAIVGLRLGTTPIALLRASMEAVALRFAAIDELLVESLSASTEVIATGGALLHSAGWMQMIADAIARPVLASTEGEASSHGAALLALEAIGCLDRPLDEVAPQTSARFEPIPAHTERYKAAAARQRRLYDALIQ